MAHVTEEEMILYYYGEAPDPGPVGRHLEACDQCRAAFDELERVFAVTLPAPEPGADYGQRVWERIRPKLPARRPFAGWWRAAGALAAVTAAAVVVLVFHPPAPVPPAPVATTAAAGDWEPVFRMELGEHFERSERFLMDALNGESVEPSARAQDLLYSNRLLRQMAIEIGYLPEAAVLEDLEFVLLEAANDEPAEWKNESQELNRDVLFRVKALGEHFEPQEVAYARNY